MPNSFEKTIDTPRRPDFKTILTYLKATIKQEVDIKSWYQATNELGMSQDEANESYRLYKRDHATALDKARRENMQAAGEQQTKEALWKLENIVQNLGGEIELDAPTPPEAEELIGNEHSFLASGEKTIRITIGKRVGFLSVSVGEFSGEFFDANEKGKLIRRIGGNHGLHPLAVKEFLMMKA
jgi:hypothetical protein